MEESNKDHQKIYSEEGKDASWDKANDRSNVKIATYNANNQISELINSLVCRNPDNKDLLKLKAEKETMELSEINTLETMNLFSKISNVIKKIQSDSINEDKVFLLQIAEKMTLINSYIFENADLNSSQKNGIEDFDNELSSELLKIENTGNTETNDIKILKDKILTSTGYIKGKLSSFIKD